MIDSYPLDKGRLYFFLGVNAILFIYMVFDQKRLSTLFQDRDKFRRSLIKMFLVGFLFLAVSSILVALSFHSWNLVKAFLLFRDIGLKPGGLPYARTIGYQFISLSIMTLLFYFISSSEPSERAEQHTSTDNINFVNARFGSTELQYAMIATMILVAPLGLLYAFLGLLASQGYIFNGLVISFFIINCLAWAGIALIIKTLRKYWVFSISTNDAGITFVGLFRKMSIHWNEIISIEIVSTGILFGGKMIEVKARSGAFFFPFTMKEREKEFPRLDMFGELWVDSDGAKKSITPENCPLYTAIKQRR